MGLQGAVQRVFDAGGPLARSVEEFKPRSGQIKMALEVARTIEQGGVLIAEAGTGVGKTFAYLVPALLSGERVLLSTATKALQDQLFGRDIPRLMAVLGMPVRVALLKGRGSYLCSQRLAQARQDVRPTDLDTMRQLARIEQWSVGTRAGDLAELSSVDEESSVIPLVTSNRENCLGARCPKIQSCHVNLARREAMSADVVVINHHLFFADLNVRESGVAELLPAVTAVIFDEAHQLNEIGVQFLGQQLTTGQLTGFCRDLAVQGAQWARGLANWHLMVMDIERAIAAWRRVCGDAERTDRRRWGPDGPDSIPLVAWAAAMDGLRTAVRDTELALRTVVDIAPDLQALQARAVKYLEKIHRFAQPVPPGVVRWLEAGTQIRLLESPLDIAQAMQTRVLGGNASDVGRRSWIFTSATLGNDAKLEWFVESCGLEGAQLLQVESPFDYAVQASLYIPEQMPKPSDPSHSHCVAMLVADAAEILGGRTLLLTTTLRAMRSIGDALTRYFHQTGGIDVLVQGQASKRELLERFCQTDGTGATGCILVASATFWEGVDIPGDALQLVVIDKLPFSPPNDPLVEAKVRQLEAAGKNAFKHLHLPQAAIALKQGAGRLIRRETDRGVLVVCDVRLTQMGYGRKLLAALPAMPLIRTPEHFRGALGALTKPSTTDPDWT
jgi:ATP-dependent DNA helicase DinG